MEHTGRQDESTSLEIEMLLPRVERFLRVTGMPWTKFGRLAAGDPRLVADMRNGRVPRPSLEQKLEHFMNTYSETTHAH